MFVSPIPVKLASDSQLAKTATVASHTICTPPAKAGWYRVDINVVSNGTNTAGTISIALGYKSRAGATQTYSILLLPIAGATAMQSLSVPLYLDASATAITGTYTLASVAQGVDILAVVYDMQQI